MELSLSQIIGVILQFRHFLQRPKDFRSSSSRMRQLAQSFSTQAWRRCMSLAESCITMKELKPIHAIFVTNGLHMNNYAISKLIAFCSLSGNLRYASLLFDQIHSPNSFIYNTLIRGCARSSQPQSALRYFNLMMHDESVAPDHLTFPFVFMACGGSDWVLEGKQIHGLVVRNGIGCSDGHVRTGLVRFYVDSRVLGDARKVFDEIPLPDLIQWNVMINGYVRFGLASDALRVYGDMLVCGVEPDEFCVATGLAACAQAGAFWQGRLIHEYVEERKWVGSDVFVGTALVDMYAKCGCIDMAVEVFEKMHRRNVFSWAAMIGGFAIHGNAGKAFECLERMQVEDGFRPDGVVLLGVLSACTHAGMVEEGKLLLDEMRTRYGVVPKHEHYSCVVDLLCRAGRLDEAIRLIRNMPMKPLASVWGALLSGCRTHNNVDLAELAVQELVLLGNSDVTGEDGAYVQLSNIYLNAKKSEDASRIRRMMGDRGIKKTPGCSMIGVSGKVNDFVSGDVSHPLQARIRAVLELIFVEAKGKRQDPCAIRI